MANRKEFQVIISLLPGPKEQAIKRHTAQPLPLYFDRLRVFIAIEIGSNSSYLSANIFPLITQKFC